MDKLNMKSKDMTKDNIEEIERLFPNVITEIKDNNGNISKAIDFELLQQELSGEIVEGDKERYQLTWPGKKEAILIGNTPIDKTLRPIEEDSIDWDNTENLYIEGDNLEVLKLLQESYLNKVKCIYIDPPYNTGKDFVYRDNFTQDKNEYLEESGQVDEEGNRLFLNTDANGRYHSDWLTMMYPRLKLARNLLSEDGVIFISIDDNEVHNLRKICDEIFGERNFVAKIIPVMNPRGSQSSKDIAINHEYILIYKKGMSSQLKGFGLTEEQKKEYNKKDNVGYYREIGLRKRGADSRREDSPNLYYPIYYDIERDFMTTRYGENMIEITPKLSDGSDGRWRWSKEKFEKDKAILIARTVNRNGIQEYDIFQKDYLTKDKMRKPMSIWDDKPINNEYATELIQVLFEGKKVFDYTKSPYLINKLLQIGTDETSIILDFFSGSATTAHAVMQLNAEDGGNRKYIMVQLPEETDEKSEAYKAGYKTIAEIGKERIRRAAKKIKEETDADIDYGFRVFKVDSSNMKDVYYLPTQLTQMNLDELEENIKEDRTGLDLLTQVILEAGIPLSLPMETNIINGKEVYFVDENALIACFDKDIDEGLIKEIAKEKPLKAVFRDSSFKDCPSRINLEEIFKSISPTTEIKVL